MATRNGAQTLGLEHEIGSIHAGRRADLILVDTGRPHLQPRHDPYSALVYGARADDIRMTMVDGEILVDESGLTRVDSAEIAATGRAEALALVRRAWL